MEAQGRKNCIKTWANATSTTEPKEIKYVEEKTKGTGDGA